MFSFLAFKALHRVDDYLVSPRQGTRWKREYVPFLGETYRLAAACGDIEREFGIFATSFTRARDYGNEVYLVAPDPRFPVVEGEWGWRAGAAFVVAGPFDEWCLQPAVNLIKEAYRAGYPQINDVLENAALITKDACALALSGGIKWLSIAIYEWPTEKINRCLIEAFVSKADAKMLYEAGLLLPDARWYPEIAKALSDTKDRIWLSRAVREWPEKRKLPLCNLINGGKNGD